MYCTVIESYLSSISQLFLNYFSPSLSSICPVFAQYLSSTCPVQTGQILHIYCTSTAHRMTLLLCCSVEKWTLRVCCRPPSSVGQLFAYSDHLPNRVWRIVFGGFGWCCFMVCQCREGCELCGAVLHRHPRMAAGDVMRKVDDVVVVAHGVLMLDVLQFGCCGLWPLPLPQSLVHAEWHSCQTVA